MRYVSILFVSLFCLYGFAQSRSSGSGSSGGGGAATSINFGTASLTGIVPIVNGGTAVSSVTTAPSANTFAGWDGNQNMSAAVFIEGYATTATAAGTTTLTVGSKGQQYFTGVTTQTITLPVTSTMVLGQNFDIVNASTGTLTVNSSGGNLVNTILPLSRGSFTVILTSGTTAASWYADSTPTPWFACTPTGTWVSNTTYTGFCKRVGDTLFLRFKAATSGVPTSASLTFTLPNSWTIDTAKLIATLTNGTSVPDSACRVIDNGVNNWFCQVAYQSSTGITAMQVAVSGTLLIANSPVTQAAPFAINTGDWVEVNAHLPIVGWQ